MASKFRMIGSQSSGGNGGGGSTKILGGAPVAVESIFGVTTYNSSPGTEALRYIPMAVALGSDPTMTQWNFPITNGTSSQPLYAPVFDTAGNAYLLLQPQDGSGNGLPSVAKVGNNGILQWTNQLTAGAAGNGFALGCACDGSGNVYVSAILLPSGASTTQYLSVFKFNTSGALQWHTDVTVAAGCTFLQSVQSPTMLIVDGDGNPVVQAVVTDTSGQRIWVSKFNVTTGAQTWNYQTVESTYTINSCAIATDPNDLDAGSIYFGYGTNGNGGFVYKLSINGSALWMSTLHDTAAGSPNNAVTLGVNAITVSTSGAATIVVAGSSENPTSGIYYGFLAQFTTSGTVNWQRSAYLATSGGTTGVVLVNGASKSLAVTIRDSAVDSQGNIYAIAWLGGSNKATILMKYNVSGQVQYNYVYTYAGLPVASNNTARVALRTDNNIYLSSALTASGQVGVLNWDMRDSAFARSIQDTGKGPLQDVAGLLTITSQSVPTSAATSATFNAITNGFVVSQPTTIGFVTTTIPQNTLAGGLLWIKDWSGVQNSANHMLFDYYQGSTTYLSTSDTNGVRSISNDEEVSTFSPNGFWIGNDPLGTLSTVAEVAWAWRRQPRFFDAVLYTGNGTSQAISHNLQCQPGMIVVKNLTTSSNWPVYHKDLPNGVTFFNNNPSNNVPTITARSNWWLSHSVSGGSDSSTLPYTLGCAADSTGNFYVGANTTGAGTLIKYNSTGAVVWQVFLTSQLITDVIVDSLDGVYAICNDSTLFKFNTSGTLQWQRSVPNSVSGGYGQLASGGGFVYVFYGATGYGYDSSLSATSTTSYLTAYNAAGAFQWQRSISLNIVGGISITSANTFNIYVTGTIVSGSTHTGWLGQFFDNGTFVWQVQTAANISLNAVLATTDPGSSSLPIVIYAAGATTSGNGFVLIVSSTGTVVSQGLLAQSAGPTNILALASNNGDVYVSGVTTNTTGANGGVGNFIAFAGLINGVASGVAWIQVLADLQTSALLNMATCMALDNNNGILVGFNYSSVGGTVAYLQQDGSAQIGEVTSAGVNDFWLDDGWNNGNSGASHQSWTYTVGSTTATTSGLTIATAATNDTVGTNSTHGGTMTLTPISIAGQPGLAAQYFGNNTAIIAPTTTKFTVGSNADVNTTGNLYIAYMFAHDPNPTGIIQCGSYLPSLGTIEDSVHPDIMVNLGWQPQYVLGAQAKYQTVWQIEDTARGMAYNSFKPMLFPSETASGSSIGAPWSVIAGGFLISPTLTTNKMLYMAIRRGPMTLPTTGAQVYNAATFTGTEDPLPLTMGFQPDLTIYHSRSAVQNVPWYITAYGTRYYVDYNAIGSGISFGSMVDAGQNRGMAVNSTGILVGPLLDPASNPSLVAADNTQGENTLGRSEVVWCFTRQPNTFDSCLFVSSPAGVVQTIPHDLGVVPEMIIIVDLDATQNLYVYHKTLGISNLLTFIGGSTFNTSHILPTSPTATQLTVQELGSGDLCAAFMFATLAGVSSVGSYTGNGTSQIINCGFTTGARFVMIKKTDNVTNDVAPGDWVVFDTARGINSLGSATPFVTLNTAAVEATSTSNIGATSVGFTISQDAGTANLNANGGHYIYLAFS